MKFLKEEINNLYHAYHGSNVDFDRFDQQLIGLTNGIAQGFGFYFTSDINEAKGYGDYVIEADLLIRKPFSDDSITITKNQVKNYIREYVDPTGENYLSNYGWYEDEGYENVLNKCVESLFKYNKSDNEIISELLYSLKNLELLDEEAYDAVFKIFGKDGFIHKKHFKDEEFPTVYIVFSNSQILNKKKIKVR